MASSRQPDFQGLLARLARELSAHDLGFMLIGGQAVLLHGEPRLTEDIAITLDAPPDRLPDVLAVCRAAELEPLPDDPEAFVGETFVLPADDVASGIRIDLIFSTTPYEAEAIGRAIYVELEGTPVPFATAEDLILHKLFAGRPRDLEDARGVVRRKGMKIDWGYVRRWADEFAGVPGREGLPEAVDRLSAGD